MIKSLARRSIAIVLLLAALGWNGGPLTPARAALQTVSTCDATHLANALTQAAPGATVTFGCSGTIQLSGAGGTISIGANVTLDGSGQKVTISGGGKVQIFSVGSGVSLTLNHLTIANGNSAGNGGGIANNGGTVSVTNSTLSGNGARQFGGGIWNEGTLSITNSTLSGNSAGVSGGGIWNNGTLSVTNSTLSGNSIGVGGYSGGGILMNSGTLSVTNSTLIGNYSYKFGGGIEIDGGKVNVTNSTLIGNIADWFGGGGINTGHGSATYVTNSTFSGNEASCGGGANIYVGGLTYMGNTILAYPQNGPDCGASSGPYWNCGGSTLYDLSGNVEDGTSCGFGKSSLSNVNPLLGAPANNGGPTKTIALKSGSPAIGIASCSISIPPPYEVVQRGYFGVDQRGYIRPTSRCDAGAYDHRATQPFSTIAVSVVSNAAGMVVLAAKVDSSGPPVVVTTTTNGVTTTTTTLSPYPAHGQIFPTGTVTFHDGSTTGPVIACAEGDPVTHAVALPGTTAPESATCSTGSLAAGGHSIVAVYSGDGTFRGVDNRYGPATLTVG